MEEKDSAISGPYEEFRICFCGKIPSGSVEWYRIDVSVEEARLSEKTESRTRELTPFSVAKHLPSYAALGGHIYSLGGQRRSYDGGETLLNDVWLLDFKSIEDLKPVSIPPLSLSPSLSLRDLTLRDLTLRVEDREPTKKSSTDYDSYEAQAQKSYWEPSLSFRDKLEDDGMPTKIVDEVPAQASFWEPRSHNILETKLVPLDNLEIKVVPERKPGKYHKPDSDKASPTPLTAPSVEVWKPGSSKSHKRKYHKPDSDKLSPTPLTGDWRPKSALTEDWITGDWKPDSDKLSPTPLTEDWITWDWKPDSDELSPTPLTEDWITGDWIPPEDWITVDWKPDSGKYHKPDSDKLSPTPLTEDWKPGLPMNFARCNPHTMVVEHKLYVLGGLQPNQNPANGWIEVFNPEEKKWESLPSPPDQIHPSIMISGLRNSKKEIIIAKQRRDCHPLLFYSYNITTGCWNTVVPPESELSVHFESDASVHPRSVILPPNIGRAVTVGNTLYWISTEEHNHKCTIRAYDLDRNMWFEDHLNTATIFGRREYFSSIYSRGPGFLHLVDQKFCLLLQSTVVKKDPQSSIEYFYCVILDISPIYEHEHEDWGKFELTTVSVQKYSMDHYIDFLDCMLLLSD